MNKTTVTMARIYVTEKKGSDKIFAYLHDEGKVRGVTVFRGISGFGKKGHMHSSTLLDMSLNLPVVIEFFDTPERTESIINQLNNMVEPGHIVSWSAEVNSEE